MSIKRTKQVNNRRDDKDADSDFWTAEKKPEKTWAEQLEGKPDAEFVPYALSARFAKGALLSHPSFGKGVVTTVVGTRIEVLFESGVKKLGHAG